MKERQEIGAGQIDIGRVKERQEIGGREIDIG